MKRETIVLQFADVEDNTRNVTVGYPRYDVDSTEVKTAMDTMIESNVLMSKASGVSKKKKAYSKTVEISNFNIVNEWLSIPL